MNRSFQFQPWKTKNILVFQFFFFMWKFQPQELLSFFQNFSLALLIKVLLIKKVCVVLYILRYRKKQMKKMKHENENRHEKLSGIQHTHCLKVGIDLSRIYFKNFRISYGKFL